MNTVKNDLKNLNQQFALNQLQKLSIQMDLMNLRFDHFTKAISDEEYSQKVAKLTAQQRPAAEQNLRQKLIAHKTEILQLENFNGKIDSATLEQKIAELQTLPTDEILTSQERHTLAMWESAQQRRKDDMEFRKKAHEEQHKDDDPNQRQQLLWDIQDAIRENPAGSNPFAPRGL